MITYIENQDRTITLDMDHDDFDTLLMILGYAVGAARTKEQRWWVLCFVNELNRTNTHFRPYQQ